MHDIYIAFSSFTLCFADTCTHSVPIFIVCHCAFSNARADIFATQTLRVSFSGIGRIKFRANFQSNSLLIYLTHADGSSANSGEKLTFSWGTTQGS